jgi:hypothetical protein
MGMNFAKLYPHDYRRPSNAEEMLKKLPKMDQNTVIGFLDETSLQTTANTQRLWSYGNPTICKNTAKIRANTFGFYALNGNSVIDFKLNSKKDSVCDFLKTVSSSSSLISEIATSLCSDFEDSMILFSVPMFVPSLP